MTENEGQTEHSPIFESAGGPPFAFPCRAILCVPRPCVLRKGGNVAACCHEIFAESTPGLHAVSHPPFAKNAKDGAPHSLRFTSEIKGGPPAPSPRRHSPSSPCWWPISCRPCIRWCLPLQHARSAPYRWWSSATPHQTLSL